MTLNYGCCVRDLTLNSNNMQFHFSGKKLIIPPKHIIIFAKEFLIISVHKGGIHKPRGQLRGRGLVKWPFYHTLYCKRACFWSPFRSSTIANRRLNLVRACSKFDRRWSMVDDLIGDQKQALCIWPHLAPLGATWYFFYFFRLIYYIIPSKSTFQNNPNFWGKKFFLSLLSAILSLY